MHCKILPSQRGEYWESTLPVSSYVGRTIQKVMIMILKNYMMSVLAQAQALRLWEFPQARSYIWPYIPRLRSTVTHLVRHGLGSIDLYQGNYDDIVCGYCRCIPFSKEKINMLWAWPYFHPHGIMSKESSLKGYTILELQNCTCTSNFTQHPILLAQT